VGLLGSLSLASVLQPVSHELSWRAPSFPFLGSLSGTRLSEPGPQLSKPEVHPISASKALGDRPALLPHQGEINGGVMVTPRARPPASVSRPALASRLQGNKGGAGLGRQGGRERREDR
jgi:hypothetical protein